MKLDLETRLYLSIIASDIPAPERQKGLIEGREYAWDFYWPEKRLAVEVNGGTWVKGAHSTGSGLKRDAIKQNLAAINGYRSIIVTTDMIESGLALAMIEVEFGIRPFTDILNAGKKRYQVPYKTPNVK